MIKSLVQQGNLFWPKRSINAHKYVAVTLGLYPVWPEHGIHIGIYGIAGSVNLARDHQSEKWNYWCHTAINMAVWKSMANGHRRRTWISEKYTPGTVKGAEKSAPEEELGRTGNPPFYTLISYPCLESLEKVGQSCILIFKLLSKLWIQ